MWKIKILLQFFLSILPKGEKINHLLQRLNKRFDEEKIEKRIIELSIQLSKIDQFSPLEGATVIEIGTAWMPFCAVLFYLMGAKNCHTYDHVHHVRFNLVDMLVSCVGKQLDEISRITSIPFKLIEKRFLKLKNSKNLDDFLSKTNIIYHAPADASKTGLEDNSVDLVYSNAVLEHIPKDLVYDLLIESKRILKTSGIAYHLIGLHDHYVSFDNKISKVNFLKYSEPLWSFFVHNKISYHNRLREKQFLDIFKVCGANIIWIENKADPDDINVLKNMKIDKSFDGMSYEELATYQTELIVSFSTEH